MASQSTFAIENCTFTQIEIDRLYEKCPAHATISAQVLEVNGQFVAEIRVVTEVDFFHARSRCPSFILAKRHCLGSIYAQLRHWRKLRFRSERQRKMLERLKPITHGLPRILIVDDDPIASRLAAAAFRKASCEVITVSSGSDAMAEIARGGYDLVLLDWFLGDMEGEELLRRANSGGMLPVVIWSGQMSAVRQIASSRQFRILERWDKVSPPDQLMRKTKKIVEDLDLQMNRARSI